MQFLTLFLKRNEIRRVEIRRNERSPLYHAHGPATTKALSPGVEIMRSMVAVKYWHSRKWTDTANLHAYDRWDWAV